MRSEATTVEAYLAELEPPRRAAMEAVRDLILQHLPAGYVEAMRWGMISYEVPLSVYPGTYNGQPLSYVALASQRRYMSLYLMAIYGDEVLRERFESAYRATGKRMDVGRSCVRFRSLEGLPLDLIGEMIAAVPVEAYLEMVERTARR